MAFNNPFSGTFSYQGMIPSSAMNYINNNFPNCLDKVGGDTISGNVTVTGSLSLSGSAQLNVSGSSQLNLTGGTTLAVYSPASIILGTLVNLGVAGYPATMLINNNSQLFHHGSTTFSTDATTTQYGTWTWTTTHSQIYSGGTIGGTINYNGALMSLGSSSSLTVSTGSSLTVNGNFTTSSTAAVAIGGTTVSVQADQFLGFVGPVDTQSKTVTRSHYTFMSPVGTQPSGAVVRTLPVGKAALYRIKYIARNAAASLVAAGVVSYVFKAATGGTSAALVGTFDLVTIGSAPSGGPANMVATGYDLVIFASYDSANAYDWQITIEEELI